MDRHEEKSPGWKKRQNKDRAKLPPKPKDMGQRQKRMQVNCGKMKGRKTFLKNPVYHNSESYYY